MADVDSIGALGRVYQAERDAERIRDNLRALHYGLCAFLVKRGHSEYTDLLLTVESGNVLRDLDALRDELRAIRRALNGRLP